MREDKNNWGLSTCIKIGPAVFLYPNSWRKRHFSAGELSILCRWNLHFRWKVNLSKEELPLGVVHEVRPTWDVPSLWGYHWILLWVNGNIIFNIWGFNGVYGGYSGVLMRYKRCNHGINWDLMRSKRCNHGIYMDILGSNKISLGLIPYSWRLTIYNWGYFALPEYCGCPDDDYWGCCNDYPLVN